MTSPTTAAATAESTSRFAQTDRYRIHYHDVGAGHPIVLLHGSGPGATGWSNFWPNIGYLATHHRVIAVDMPGWGRATPRTLLPAGTPSWTWWGCWMFWRSTGPPWSGTRWAE
jgi:pimeloyl-ACP methyl ester carboxylesterase